LANQRVWAAIKGGPHTNNPDNGEEYFDKGSLAIMNGDRPLIVNATGALLRNTPSTSDGSDYYNLIYDDDFSDKGQRDVYNIFYTRQPVPRGQGTTACAPTVSARGVDVFASQPIPGSYPPETRPATRSTA